MLSEHHRKLPGRPVGLETLAATINEEAVTLEDVYEPYLMQLGFPTRTPRGRCGHSQGLSAPGAADARGRGRRRTGPAELLNRKGERTMGFLAFLHRLVPADPAGDAVFWPAFLTKPPKSINSLYGYRTARSMKISRPGTLAHRVCGKLWSRRGRHASSEPAGCCCLPWGGAQRRLRDVVYSGDRGCSWQCLWAACSLWSGH